MIRTSTLGAISILLMTLGCHPDVKVSEPEARKLAAEALETYCTDEKLSPRNFRVTEMAPSGDAQWMIVYLSSGITPAHEVVVTIGKKGNVELSRDIKDGKD